MPESENSPYYVPLSSPGAASRDVPVTALEQGLKLLPFAEITYEADTVCLCQCSGAKQSQVVATFGGRGRPESILWRSLNSNINLLSWS